MVDEKLSLTIQNGKLSVHSRSRKGSAYYLINITADGMLERCGGVHSRDTNFLCDDDVRRVVIQ